ncbi:MULTISPECIES: DUF2624 family protein [Alteribacter]|uniref:DUF2624 domain-containing protein n=1 Tax=Alteribacter keqinensis TaxID=2483800 RepID=A0A3M7TV64_9BACI|nr:MULTISPECIES: DUF2624 family protein [Alteribacter]MBM7097080.1 DUF2624 domain-containing protein [Alteribacter salitolerans]RNA68892.1 DUF2624 domain-containing protein [Alteribacter keqinensis]
MNPFIQQLVNQKINQLDVKELMRLSKQYKIPLTVRQAKQIIAILKKQPVDVGNTKHMITLQNELKSLDPSLYKKAEKLLEPYKDYINWP